MLLNLIDESGLVKFRLVDHQRTGCGLQIRDRGNEKCLAELTKLGLLKDVFIPAYERSAARCAAVRQSLGEPDPFRLPHRHQLRDLIGDLVRARVGRKDAAARIAAWSQKEIHPEGRNRFAELAETKLISLHEGNFARDRIRPSEFAAWRQVWEPR